MVTGLAVLQFYLSCAHPCVIQGEFMKLHVMLILRAQQHSFYIVSNMGFVFSFEPEQEVLEDF